MPPKTQSCLSCYYFLESGKNENGKIGYCRAEPPRSYYEQDSDGKITPKIARFPIVLSDMWCGAWDGLTPTIKEVNLVKVNEDKAPFWDSLPESKK